MSLTRLFQLALPITRGIQKKKLYDWIIAVSQFLDEDFPGALSVISEPADGLRTGMVLNSLCEPNLSFPEWSAVNSTRRWAHMATDQQTLDAVQLNPLGNAAGTGEFRWQQVLPPGSDGATLSFRIAEANSLPVQIGIYDSDMTTILAQTACATSPTFGSFSVSLPAHSGIPTPHNYGFWLQVTNVNQQARPFVSQASITPTFPSGFGTGTFQFDPLARGLNFRRIALSQALAIGNQLAGVNSSVYPYLNSYADFPFETSGLSCAVEGYNLASDGVLWTFLNGSPLLKAAGAAVIPNGKLGMQDVIFGAAPQQTTQVFKLRTGFAVGPVNTTNLGTGALITAPRALYIPANASFAFVPNRGRSKCIVHGDSITAGFQATNPGFQGWFARFREWYPGEVIMDAVSGQAFFNYVGSATPPQDHPDLQLRFAQYSARSNPTDIIFDLGVNDYNAGTGGNGWTAAAFQTALLGYVTDVMALAPQARIWLKSMTITGTEGVANGAGSTPPNYRTAVSNVVGIVNDPRVIFIDGLGALFHVAGDLVDNVHPNTNGQQKDGEAMISAFGAVFAI